jgi:2-polyprenyl-3-methyl-5-hydroxy-6-metoxy-1,4-benzoquinol methylase
MNLIEVPCSNCGSRDAELLDVRPGMTNVQCRRCGLIYINPRATEAEYAAYYAKGFTQEFNQAAAAKPEDLAAQAQPKSERIVKFLDGELRSGMSVLDIGCGYGNVLAILRDKFGADVTGLEPDPKGPEVAKKVFGLDVYPVTLDEYLEKHNAGKKFDLIILHQVLEHLLEPDEMGAALSRLMRPGASVYVGTPNASWPGCDRKSFYRFPHVTNPTPYTLGLFLWRHGFKLVKIGDLHKPLAFLAVVRTDEREAAPWTMLLKASWPMSRLRRRMKLAFAWHSLRGLRKRNMRFVPAPLKQTIKALVRPKKT